jgi:hypothetical protein
MVNGASLRARRFRNAAIAAIGFILVCALLGAILPFPEIGNVAAELRYFRKHRDRFDTIFVGSSLTHRDISPAVFDRVTRERGHPTRSFNFGVDGMLLPESSFVLERLLELRPLHLKWVFIEFDEIDPRPFAGAQGSRRDIYWRDWTRTSLLLEKVLRDHGKPDTVEFRRPLSQVREQPKRFSELRLLLFHLSLFAKNETNFSRRIDLIWWGSHFWKPDKMPEDLGPDGDGYAPLVQDFPAEKVLPYEYARAHARDNVGERFVSTAAERACRRMAAEVRKAGATPIFLVMPVLSQTKVKFRPEAPAPSVLAFNDMTSYPQLYGTEVRAEELHLNPKGAAALSTLVAEDLSRLIDQKQLVER